MLGLHRCLVVSCVHVHCTVKYDAGNCNMGGNTAESRGNVWEFYRARRVVTIYVCVCFRLYLYACSGSLVEH